MEDHEGPHNLTHCLISTQVAPLLAAKREWCKTSREAATTLKIIDAYFAEEARGALATVDRSRVYVTGPSCGGLGAYLCGNQPLCRVHPTTLH